MCLYEDKSLILSNAIFSKKLNEKEKQGYNIKIKQSKRLNLSTKQSQTTQTKFINEIIIKHAFIYNLLSVFRGPKTSL